MKLPLFLLLNVLVACGSSESEPSSPSGAAGTEAPVAAPKTAGGPHGGLTITQLTGPDAGRPLASALGSTLEGHASAGSATGPTFVTPEGWTEQNPENSMSHKQYQLPGAEGTKPALAVVAYWPAGMEDLEMNLNRWVGQVGSKQRAADLGPTERWVTESDDFVATHVHLLGAIKPMEGMAKTIEATDAGAILAAYIKPKKSPGVWTIKVTGNSKTVEAHKARYSAFVGGL